MYNKVKIEIELLRLLQIVLRFLIFIQSKANILHSIIYAVCDDGLHGFKKKI